MKIKKNSRLIDIDRSTFSSMNGQFDTHLLQQRTIVMHQEHEEGIRVEL
jgi:hypothetical protein